MNADTAILMAGVPSSNKAVFHRVRFAPHDPVSWIQLSDGRRIMIVRDVELPRAKRSDRADVAHAYEDFAPADGLSGDRAIRAAQATAECLVRKNVKRVIADRTLLLIYVDELRRRGIDVECDLDLGIIERRQKDADEVAALREAQRVTELAIRHACEFIATSVAGDDGALHRDGRPVTSERVRDEIDGALRQHGCSGEGHIVAGGPDAADCHFGGRGQLYTGGPIIVDVFPRHLATGYHGDCTRTVVHGDIPLNVAKMHEAVVEAKAASLTATKAGVTGEAVHQAAVDVLHRHGYATGFASNGKPGGYMPHGTGHGIGLDLKEPPLLDMGGPELLVGDAITVEPALYDTTIGGIRLEDLVIVTENGYENLNTLPESLDWRP